MKPFKVICKASGDNWQREHNHEKAEGPTKEEICLVIDIKESNGYYRLKGYPEDWYDHRWFVRVDEVTVEYKQTEYNKIIEEIPACDN